MNELSPGADFVLSLLIACGSGFAGAAVVFSMVVSKFSQQNYNGVWESTAIGKVLGYIAATVAFLIVSGLMYAIVYTG